MTEDCAQCNPVKYPEARQGFGFVPCIKCRRANLPGSRVVEGPNSPFGKTKHLPQQLWHDLLKGKN